jgi:hypothetical protein
MSTIGNKIYKVDFVIGSDRELDRNKRQKYKLSFVPDMGLIDAKAVDSTANVINKVEVGTYNLDWITLILGIIATIMIVNALIKLYKLHNKCLKKKYESRANDLDKI